MEDGINWEDGTLYLNSGTVENNTAGTKGNEIYPKTGYLTDTTKPTIKVGEISEEWTSEDVVVTITVSDDETGVKQVTVDGVEIEGTDGVYTYTVSKNGTYEVTAIDYSKNEETTQFVVTNIDKTAPIIYGATEGKTYDETIKITIRDEDSGISSITLVKDGEETEITDKEFELSENGEYTIKVIDNAGNETKLTFTINIIKSTDDGNNNGENDGENDNENDGENNGKNDDDEEDNDGETEEIDNDTENVSDKEDGGTQEEIEESVSDDNTSGTLPYTGIKGKIPIFIILVVISGTIIYNKFKLMSGGK